jgi:Ni2+-binding GTPase involved in maturation of urease and hydrogenase
MAVFVCTGKMGSGKTTLVKETVMTQEWIAEGKTLLITGEDGEVKYDEEYVAENHIVLVSVADIKEMTADFFDELVEKHQPVQVVIECAEDWNMEEFMNLMYPEDWDLQGVYSTVDGTAFENASDAEREEVFANLTESDLIIVNRCKEGFNRAELRRAIRMINPGADMIFEDLKGQVIQPTEEDLPYDMSVDTVKISDEDFGFFYLDTFDNPDRYNGKTVQLKVQTLNAIDLEEKLFIAARKIAMGETEFHGYPCIYQGDLEIQEEGWAVLTAQIKYEHFESDDEKQPVLYFIHMEETEAPENQVIDLGM